MVRKLSAAWSWFGKVALQAITSLKSEIFKEEGLLDSIASTVERIASTAPGVPPGGLGLIDLAFHSIFGAATGGGCCLDGERSLTGTHGESSPWEAGLARDTLAISLTARQQWPSTLPGHVCSSPDQPCCVDRWSTGL